MRHVTRWWESMGKAERITAMSLATGALIAIVNSTVWAIATSYIVRRRTLAEIELARYGAAPAGQSEEAAARQQPATADEDLVTPSI
jgi:hypothetical protein